MTIHQAEFADGPLDGVTFDVPGVLDQVALVFRDKVLRYEVDQEITMTESVGDQFVCRQVYRLVETRDRSEFDEELSQELKK